MSDTNSMLVSTTLPAPDAELLGPGQEDENQHVESEASSVMQMPTEEEEEIDN